MKQEPGSEHRWLERLVGEWTCESESVMGPDGPTVMQTGAESVRSLGGFWVICDGWAKGADGEPMTTVMTLGYDPAHQHYLGTFVGSMMPFMWVYEGELDASQQVLTLTTQGPSFTTEGQMSTYKDIIEFKDDDHRLLRSTYLGDDGAWHEFMRSTYHRTKHLEAGLAQ